LGSTDEHGGGLSANGLETDAAGGGSLEKIEKHPDRAIPLDPVLSALKLEKQQE
jgi:hypothetical protein